MPNNCLPDSLPAQIWFSIIFLSVNLNDDTCFSVLQSFIVALVFSRSLLLIFHGNFHELTKKFTNSVAALLNFTLYFFWYGCSCYRPIEHSSFACSFSELRKKNKNNWLDFVLFLFLFFFSAFSKRDECCLLNRRVKSEEEGRRWRILNVYIDERKKKRLEQERKRKRTIC